jgi:hypothetical protein
VGRHEQPLATVAEQVAAAGGQAQAVTADLTEPGVAERVITASGEHGALSLRPAPTAVSRDLAA